MRSASVVLACLLLATPATAERLFDAASGPARVPDAATPATPCGSTEGLEIGPRLRPLVELRQAKCGTIAPYEPTFLERQILGFEKAERPSIFQLNLFGLYPRLQTIDHRSQIAGGARLLQPGLGGSPLDLTGTAFWSLPGFQYYDAQLGLLPGSGRGFPLFSHKADDVFEQPNVRFDEDRRTMLFASYAYRWSPKFDFFGLGPDSRKEDQSDFRQKDSVVELVAGYRVLAHLTLSARAGYYRVSLGPGTDEELPNLGATFSPEEVPGYDQQPDFLRMSAGAVLDLRDVAENPHRGAVLAGQWQRYDQRGGDAQSFDRFGADARVYLPLGHPQRMLVLRAYGSRDRPRAGQVPFYLQAFLGSSHALRGFQSQRFRGEKVAALQAEYRWEAAPALELATFVETGTVATLHGDPLGSWKTAGGVGLRVKTHETVMLRFDFAWSHEGFRFLWRFSPSY
ncbi:MAG: BamA/TamA family outer membrane protein [Vicinamibacteria bacterium]